MKILIFSQRFFPSVGGTERNVDVFAGEFIRQGNEVIVVTNTRSDKDEPRAYKVIRNPSLVKFLRLFLWCDVYFVQGLALKAVLPFTFGKRKIFIGHQSWLRKMNGELLGIGGTDKAPIVKLKKWIAKFYNNICISHAISTQFKWQTHVIHNPYDTDLFYRKNEINCDKEIVFAGRLVSEKGVSLLIEAIHQLNTKQIFPQVTIIGEGPEQENLECMASKYDMGDKVQFMSFLDGENLANELNRHKIIVIPSVYDEPFGLISLEGMACGCVPVASSGGGLSESVGPCGITFNNGNLNELVNALEGLLSNSDLLLHYREISKKHLVKFQKSVVISKYINHFSIVQNDYK